MSVYPRRNFAQTSTVVFSVAHAASSKIRLLTPSGIQVVHVNSSTVGTCIGSTGTTFSYKFSNTESLQKPPIETLWRSTTLNITFLFWRGKIVGEVLLIAALNSVLEIKEVERGAVMGGCGTEGRAGMEGERGMVGGDEALEAAGVSPGGGDDGRLRGKEALLR